MAALTEQQTRETIDAMLAASGLAVQGYKAFDPSTSITLPEEASEWNRIQVSFHDLAGQTRIVAEVEQRLRGADELKATATTNLQRASRLWQSI